MGYCSNFFSGGRGMMRGGMFGMGLLWWVLVAVVIIGAVYFMKNRTNQQINTSNPTQTESAQQAARPSAFDVLDEEYAKGNITEEEYVHKKEVLRK
ncbi:hypothetical protein ATZ33_00695 [Enterococcus silesiacus]|uniref:SHOCT domain-containing protein n=2 Tax=Enterococcus silesiacus TaxID=332949 RepID=A0A0S3K6M6_9ENTE|nr:hypothetical protein ATZ33_00695 [Enterococcus silesiacus]OJG92742.1 hypothetical protein RV15_GL002687 [Enterococcus silesiacus]